MMEIKDTCTAAVREQKLLELYKCTFPVAARFVARRGGSLEQAKDIFQDAVVIWYEKSGGLKDQIVKSDEAYIFGVVRNLWHSRYSKENNNVALENIPLELAGETESEPSFSRVLHLLESSGRKCLEMLKSFYYDKLSMSELAAGFGFKSERSATVQKYKCLEKVRETVKEKALQYEDFLD